MVNVTYENPITNEITKMATFNTIWEAERWIEKRSKVDPHGVYNGEYSIIAPEEMYV